METLLRICREQNVLPRISRERDLTSLSHDLGGQRFLWRGREYALSLLGAHQLRNAAVVLETVGALRSRGWVVPEEAVFLCFRILQDRACRSRHDCQRQRGLHEGNRQREHHRNQEVGRKHF